MSALVCDLCGGKLKMGAGGIATCDSCGMEHSPDRMKEKVQEVKGTVKVDNSHMIDNYLEMAQTAQDSGNNEEAEVYCNKIIEIEPTNYQAWMLKGEAAAWQSTLQNSRVDEGVNAFIKGINNAPDEEKEELIEVAKEQIKKLSVAMISLRSNRFAKWPDKEETAGYISDLAAILSTVVSFLAQTGSVIPISEIMAPVATLINQSVVKAYRDIILPEYKSDRYPWPNDDDFNLYIERLGYCTNLVEKAIGICDDDDEEDIHRYENLIFFHKEAIDACSYDWEYADLDEQWKVNSYARKPGLYPVARENRVYFKALSLNQTSITNRKRLISQYESKIREIKTAKSAKEAAERAEKERIEREEAQKRYNAYWKEHIDERKQMEAELESIKAKINQLNSNYNVKIEEVNKQILELPGYTEISHLDERINQLIDNKNSLGIFKVKEKKTLQEQIDKLISEKNNIKDRMESDKKELEAKLIVIRDEINSKITPLRNRENTITNELNKPR